METKDNGQKRIKTSGKLIGCILYPDAKMGSFNSADQLIPMWNFYGQTCKVAYILHDKDHKENGDPIKPHYHLIISSRSTFSLRPFQEQWKISGHCSMILDKWDESVQYLVHQNPNYNKEADGGHIYDIKEISANFTLDRYFNSLSSTDPEYIQLLKIINWAQHNKANYYQILKFAGENGYFSCYRRCYKLIYDILGSKPYATDSDVETTEVSSEFIPF